MRRNARDYVKSWGAVLIRGAASNPEFTVVTYFCGFLFNAFFLYGIYFTVNLISVLIFTICFHIDYEYLQSHGFCTRNKLIRILLI